MSYLSDSFLNQGFGIKGFVMFGWRGGGESQGSNGDRFEAEFFLCLRLPCMKGGDMHLCESDTCGSSVKQTTTVVPAYSAWSLHWKDILYGHSKTAIIVEIYFSVDVIITGTEAWA